MDLEKGQAGAHNSSAAGGPLTSSDDTEDDDNDDDDNHGAPDLAHQRIEDMVPGHSLDRELSRTRDVESIRTIETRHTVRSKVSRVFSRQSRKSNAGDGLKHARIPETDLDAGVVGWDSQDDPAMPLNFPPAKKWLLVALLSAITFVTPFASSILSPGIANLLQDFGESSSIVGAMTVSIYLLGYVVGPMFLAPMSEIYGRRPILGLANISFCCWQIGCALSPNIVALIIFRFLSGVGGSGCLTLGGGLIADIFRPEQRGFAMGMWLIGPIIGPTVGPLIGGFVAETIGWRWDFWLVLMIAVPITALIEIFNQETSYYILVKNKTARLCKQVGRDDLRSCYDTMTNLPGNKKASRGRILFNGLVRPLKMLFLSPIVLLLTLYMSFVYGALYLLFTTIPTVFEDTYGFNTGLTGLVYLGIGTGTTLGWVILTLYSDKTVIYLAKKNNGEFVPEMRLWMAIWFSWLMPITFFWYGWCAEYKVQWMSPILSFIPFGTGLMGLFMPINTYVV
ncbi:major facilitator superfamily domain-containing protein, partial [Coniella lustricola]